MELFESVFFIPINTEGKQLDTEYSVTVQSVPEGAALFQAACTRLLRPSEWHRLAGDNTAEFYIYGKDPINSRQVEIGDRLFIDIPGSGILKPAGHDWVEVEAIHAEVVKQADESIGITLRACPDPTTPEANTAHFFKDHATSTLIVKRIDNVVTASYHGRNEKANLETGDIATNVRNGLVALGAMLGFSRIQWDALLRGLLSNTGKPNDAKADLDSGPEGF